MLCRSDLLFFNRLKNKPAAATPISTFGLGFHNGEEHAAADVTRFVNLHVRLLQFAGAIFKFDNHVYLSRGGQKPYICPTILQAYMTDAIQCFLVYRGQMWRTESRRLYR